MIPSIFVHPHHIASSGQVSLVALCHLLSVQCGITITRHSNSVRGNELSTHRFLLRNRGDDKYGTSLGEES